MYGPELARIHHERFGDIAGAAAEELLRRLRDAGIWRGAVADLGCGSGILCSILSQAGYAAHGVDRSPDMLAIASETAPRATFHEGSWVDAELPPGTVAVACVGESLNYMDDPAAGVEAIGRLAHRALGALPPRGLLMLDVAGPGRGGPAGNTSSFRAGEGWAIGTRAQEFSDRDELVREISVFSRDGDAWQRADETHRMALHNPDALARLLEMTDFH
ncbi:MAG: class I SAM-dependent methyltransferase, partial [Miltoncostaeaceae bacterium]